ncbi:hypothetical protein H4R19_004106, partial [Coemansia spiralis]
MSDFGSDNFMYESDGSEEFCDDSDGSDTPLAVGAGATTQSSQPPATQTQGQYSADAAFDDEDDDYFMDDGGFEPVVSRRNQRKPWEVDFKVYDPASLSAKQRAMVGRLEPLLALSTETTTLLLRCYLWKEESLLEDFLTDRDGTLAKVGLPEHPPSPRIETGDDAFVCEICYCGGGDERYLALWCGHRFCSDCYRTYVGSKVLEGESWRVRCPAPRCKTLVGLEPARLVLAGDTAALARYEENLTRSFVNDLSTFVWCPAPNCEYAVECQVPRSAWTATVPAVRCRCGNAFCFGCKQDDHTPAPCYLVARWLQKCRDDSETSNWMKANTKECIKCKSTIEKNGGCNHMTCRECHHQFCWVCMGPWTEHGQSYYSCNRFDEDSSKNARDSVSQSRAILERYLHYFTRYNNHEQSARLARKLLAATEKNMEQIQREHTLSWIEVQFL